MRYVQRLNHQLKRSVLEIPCRGNRLYSWHPRVRSPAQQSLSRDSRRAYHRRGQPYVAVGILDNDEKVLARHLAHARFAQRPTGPDV